MFRKINEGISRNIAFKELWSYFYSLLINKLEWSGGQVDGLIELIRLNKLIEFNKNYYLNLRHTT
jgi:hypothetical protein